MGSGDHRLPASTRWLIAAAVGAWAALGTCRAEVELAELPASSRWAGATEPQALRLACSPTAAELEELFGREGLPFRRDLLRREGQRVCHVLYRPTVPGFRAAADEDPITEILFDSDPLLYLAAAAGNRGEPVGAMREVLSRIPRPLDVGILVHRVHDESAYRKASERSFGGTPHRVTLRERGIERSFWWVQDYLKSGTSSRGETILIPRRIFEGRPENASAFEPLLERFSRRERVARSRLSWEGGDLQFTRDPKDARRLLLYYGSFVKPYWGESLTPGEFEYVLRLEFGADRAFDLGGLAPHVDYVVCFLARAKTALVSVPRSGDLGVARAALAVLLRLFAGREPAVLRELREVLSSPEPDRRRVGRILEQARQQQRSWAFAVDPSLPDRMKALVARACPGERDCFAADNQARLSEADPALFAEWVHAVQDSREEQATMSAHLDLIASQLEPVPEAVRRLTLQKIRELEAIGLRVIQVPAFRVNLIEERDWPGISYVNGLVVDEQIFVPAFGLGEVEDRIFREVRAELPDGYSIVPVYAQRVLIRNGGLHCLTGLVRSPSR